MYESYKSRAAFLFVYIREAHPTDGWQMDANVKQKVLFPQPTSLTQRNSVATQCCQRTHLPMPCAVDTIDNKVDEAYAAWPERFFIITPDNRIAYAGRQGPFGFDPDEVTAWLNANTH